MISASSLARLDACSASEHLPQAQRISEWSESGRVLHKFLEDTTNLGMSAAMELVPKEHKDACAMIGLDSLPAGQPGSYSAEVALAFDTETFAVRHLGNGLKRDYGDLKPSEIPMTLDCLGVSEDAVVVADYKTGWGHQEADSWQLRCCAMAAATLYGKSEAFMVAILLRPGDDPIHLTAHMDAFEIAQAMKDVADLVARVRKASAADMTVGSHCRFCPSQHACPAQMNTVIALAKESTALTPQDIAAGLTVDTAASAWAKLKAAKNAMENIEAALRLFAERTPFKLASGKTVGPYQTTKETIDGGAAFRVIREMHGQDVADAAAEIKTSKSRIENALRSVALAKGATLASLNREVLEKIRAAGGAHTSVGVSVGEHVAK